MLRLIEQRHDRPVHDFFLHGLLAHVLLVVLEVHRVEELRVRILGLVQPLQMLRPVLELTKRQSLLIVNLLVLGPHVLHDGDFGWDLALRGPAFGQEGADVRLVQVCVVVRRVLAPIDVHDGRVMEVMVVREHSFLQRRHLLNLSGCLGSICGC